MLNELDDIIARAKALRDAYDAQVRAYDALLSECDDALEAIAAERQALLAKLETEVALHA